MHGLETIQKMNQLASTKRSALATRKANRPNEFNRETPPSQDRPPEGFVKLKDGALLCQSDIFWSVSRKDWFVTTMSGAYGIRGKSEGGLYYRRDPFTGRKSKS